MTDAGSGTVLAIALIGAFVAAIFLATLVFRIALDDQELQDSVDLAAIGGSQTYRGINTGIPCDRVNQILTLNRQSLESCLIVGEEVKVAGTSVVMGIVLNATATAVGD